MVKGGIYSFVDHFQDGFVKKSWTLLRKIGQFRAGHNQEEVLSVTDYLSIVLCLAKHQQPATKRPGSSVSNTLW